MMMNNFIRKVAPEGRRLLRALRGLGRPIERRRSSTGSPLADARAIVWRPSVGPPMPRNWAVNMVLWIMLVLALHYLDILVLSDTGLFASGLRPKLGLWPLLIPLITAAGTAIAGGLAARAQKKSTEKTAAYNSEMAKYAYSKDLEMWNRGNEYNSPEAQQLRLRSAGLNPNLVYGSGSVAGNTSGQLPKYQAPTADFKYKSPVENLPETISSFLNSQLVAAQTDNVKANTDSTRQRTINDTVRERLLGQQEYGSAYDNAIKGLTVDSMRATVPYQGSIARSMAERGEKENEFLGQRIIGQSAENERRAQDVLFSKYRNEWMRAGITSSDHIILRLLVRSVDGDWSKLSKGAVGDFIKGLISHGK